LTRKSKDIYRKGREGCKGGREPFRTHVLMRGCPKKINCSGIG
jgi:hypothetical protein